MGADGKVINAAFQSTPLMRGETEVETLLNPNYPISIHSPHARGDTIECKSSACWLVFQSTPLMRGETIGIQDNFLMLTHFNPLPSCEGRLQLFLGLPYKPFISIHSPHARGDSINFQRIHRIQGSLYNTIHFT